MPAEFSPSNPPGTSQYLRLTNIIGGTGPNERNCISGNTDAGIWITGSGVSQNSVRGNYIGDGPGTGNLISGNTTLGVLIADPPTSGNFVRNNRIVPAPLVITSLISQFDGIWLTAGSLSNTIGGTSLGAANVIAGHPGRGIVLFDGPTASQSFRRNSIFDNGWQGIALYSGSNNSQAAPVISSAVLGLGTTVTGSLTSTPGKSFTNLQEFVAGTNPNDATSRLVSAGALSGGNFAVSWGSVAGKFYRLERSDSLSGSWQVVALHVAGTGGSVQVLVPVSLTNARQFFRVTAGE